ncbi:MAG: bifunctional [glutamate--ammonia ligase]-adenylyl-L-tyrosine phosphorylase/[glutamate--ammonia-ligase] adenylyltransferase [Mariprofundales bacterium]|nr:bifunctional [glutamate--ammonia ligase]-adenylyl-L-tyrosine phosphorylase/[glutamate--ammonia-ligase] adenylyltransferase [Mariprofundales bacterium]
MRGAGEIDCYAHSANSIVLPLLKENLAMTVSDISPYFTTLLQRAELSVDDMATSLVDAKLPDGTSMWVPPYDPSDVAAAQRYLRRRFAYGMVHIIWWEMQLHGDIEQSWRAISSLADALLQAAECMAVGLIAPRFGTLPDGEYCLVGLGKLGGNELNLGSDVDLLAVWRGSGCSCGGKKSVEPEIWFAHLTRMIIQLIDAQTEDGAVWPVDMRLRPGGASAPVALSLDATLDHYHNYGQTWERAMLSKARPVAGSLALGKELVDALSPFIYLRHLDYTTVNALAEMKSRIDAQSRHHHIAAGFDVKRGRGGIREIEFMIQSRLLLYGGRHAAIRHTGSMEALAALESHGFIAADDGEMMRESYRFWRRIEHAIQARSGEQTQLLPDDYADWLGVATAIDAVEAAMSHHSQRVRAAFQHHIAPVASADGEEGGAWLLEEPPALPEVLDAQQQRRIHLALAAVRNQLQRGVLPERCHTHLRRILDRAMPIWLEDANGVDALEAFADFIHNIAGRATWIDLLATHEGALQWFIGALATSRYISRNIVNNPAWLEWPLEQESHGHDIDAIYRSLLAIDPSDEEHALADIGRLVDRGRLLVALAVDAHDVDVATLGRWLARVADGATTAALQLGCRALDLAADFPLVALAMGKHGSQEMGLTSDLDMVFVLADDEPMAQVGNRSKIEQAQRLGRRVIQILTAAPPYGGGFEFDARLRPSGESGALVTTLARFAHYQRHEAASWEHQALCRARALAIDGRAAERVAAAVAATLAQPRDRQLLARDMVAMRQKMVRHLASRSRDVINLKQDPGGVVDIEFMAQYAKLVFAVEGQTTADILCSLPPSVPAAWHKYGGELAACHLNYRAIDLLLRVELWRSLRTLPASAAAPEWETLRRHSAIDTPESLRSAMDYVHTAFVELLSGG